MVIPTGHCPAGHCAINWGATSRITNAIARDRDNRKKRLEITKQIQLKNNDLTKKTAENESLMIDLRNTLDNEERSREQIEKQNHELISWKEENERIGEELKLALKIAEDAKTVAQTDLDILQKKTQFELIGVIVKVALYVILGVGLISTSMYMIAIFLSSPEAHDIGAAWTNLFGILLTNAFSIIGTIMGVKYASEKQKNC